MRVAAHARSAAARALRCVAVVAASFAFSATGDLAVGPGPQPLSDGLLAVYDQNRRDGTPNYITEDLILVAYGMVAVDVSRIREREQGMPRLAKLIDALREGVSAGDGDAEDANRDFVAVLHALFDDQQRADGVGMDSRAQAELDLVTGARGVAASPLWGRQIDYSQFRPRGYYAEDAGLARYFRAVRYAGAALFPVQASKATGVQVRHARRAAQQARQFADLIESDPGLSALYEEILDDVTWRIGPPEDLAIADLRTVPPSPGHTYGERLLAYARTNGAQPDIVGDVVDRSKLESGLSLADALTGWRLLPQRRTPESEAFQALVFDSTGAYTGPTTHEAGELPRPRTLTMIDGQPVKGFPVLAELFCMWGSQPSCHDVHAQHEDRFERYDEASETARLALSSARGLSALHRSVLVSALRGCAERCDDRLTALRAFWTWQRYAAVLHAKQSYTPSGKSISLDARRRPGAAIEPSLVLYHGLAHVVQGHRRFTPHPSWDTFAAILDQVIEVAARADRLSADDETFLNDLNTQLKALLGGMDAPIVVDVHSSPARGQVLYEATGWARVVDETNRAWSGSARARGARLSQCEFFGPIDARLTDAEWRRLLPQSLEPGPFMLGKPCPPERESSVGTLLPAPLGSDTTMPDLTDREEGR